MKSVFKVAGTSRQAAHKFFKQQAIFHERLAELILEVDILREEHPGCGVKKMYRTLQPDWLGRDNFIALCMTLGYTVKIQKIPEIFVLCLVSIRLVSVIIVSCVCSSCVFCLNILCFNIQIFFFLFGFGLVDAGIQFETNEQNERKEVH